MSPVQPDDAGGQSDRPGAGEGRGDAAETARIRALVRENFAPSLWLPKLLGANPKTFLIAGAILAGSPVWYFLAMIGPVNLILLVSIVHHKRLSARVADMLRLGQ